eukprot:COSAG01_NODE_3603_length_5885_cov_6.630315_3_plen_128_part_00
MHRAARRSKFSRRRKHNEDRVRLDKSVLMQNSACHGHCCDVQDVDSINERNAVYNRKIARAFVSCCQLSWLCIRLYDFFIIPCPGQIHRRNSAKSGKGNSVAFVNVHVLQPIMRRFYVEHTRRGTRP